MIKITYGQMKSPMFRAAMGKLANTPAKDPKIGYTIAKVVKKIEEENLIHDKLVAPYQTERDANVQMWAQKGEDGEPLAHPGQGGKPGFVIAPEYEEKWQEYLKFLQAKVDEVDKIEFEINRPMLRFPIDLGSIQLSPNEINGALCLLDMEWDPEVVDAPKPALAVVPPPADPVPPAA